MSPRRHLHRLLPDRHALFANRWLRPLAPWLDRPAYWAFNRRKVALAVAVGLFSGLMPGPTQMLTAAILALLIRVNLPVAVFTTLYTNPFTYLPLYFLAFRYGEFILGHGHAGTMAAQPEWNGQGLWAWGAEWGHWLGQLGLPLLIGVPALGLSLGVIGYFVVRGAWRLYLLHAWKKRKQQRGTDRTRNQ
ncbi:hypothetical protein EV683_10480 [Crenobacter luteus]|uniref:DUF2062 domain-containing protein n=1 Tax=Crenobacter luteus TaxID=1452487 RepID=A0A163BBH0_9NEIS|nr:DUF2062 domain-containing protein [Crenobacter luteus]KZE25910.1 hypothetical protein AVW16_02475 [Crenobacter luteus]TCP14532.1 hypothetical protein EV683_10480 [Crenobacter luteus]